METLRQGSPRPSRPIEPRQRLFVLVALSALTLLGLALRFAGIGFELPHKPVNDEQVFLGHVELMRSDDPQARFDNRFGFYPHLIPRLALLLPTRDPGTPPATLEAHLARASSEHVRMRAIVSSVSLLIVPATYLFASLFLSRAAALLAAGLSAASVLHVWYSSQARPHGPLIGFLVLSIYGAVRARRRGDPGSYLLAGSTAALAAGCLQSGLLAFLPLAAAHALRRRPRPSREHAWFAVALACGAVSVWLLYPFLFTAERDVSAALDASATDGAPTSHRLLGEAELWTELFDGGGFAVLLQALWDYDPWILALAVLGSCATLPRAIDAWRSPREPVDVRRPMLGRWLAGREDLAVVLAFVVPYVVAFGLYRVTAQRYALPLVPFAACLAAFAVQSLAARLHALRVPLAWRRAAIALVALAVLGVQAAATAAVVAVRTARDTRELAADWIQSHVHPGRDRIALLPTLDLPLVRDPPSLSFNPNRFRDPSQTWINYQGSLPSVPTGCSAYALYTVPKIIRELPEVVERGVVAYLREHGIEYIVLEYYSRPVLPKLYDDVRSHGVLEARISPMRVDTGDGQPLGLRDVSYTFPVWPSWLWRALHARALGPVLEVWRLR